MFQHHNNYTMLLPCSIPFLAPRGKILSPFCDSRIVIDKCARALVFFAAIIKLFRKEVAAVRDVPVLFPLKLRTGFFNGGITRAEFAAMLVRALDREGKAPALTSQQVEAALSGFADLDKLSGWARGAAAAGVQAGLMKGRTPTTLNPEATCTRAEGAVLLRRLLDKLD